MFRFKIVLLVLAKLLQRAAKSNPDCVSHVKGKDLIFQIRTMQGSGRYFMVKNGGIKSASGMAKNPKFTLTFRDGRVGFSVLSAKDGKEAFLSALHQQDLVVTGDFVEVMWFQRLADYLKK
ncbi:SCP2 sterol-binding domain-containing protein [Ralstonia nicotianae]